MGYARKNKKKSTRVSGCTQIVSTALFSSALIRAPRGQFRFPDNRGRVAWLPVFCKEIVLWGQAKGGVTAKRPGGAAPSAALRALPPPPPFRRFPSPISWGRIGRQGAVLRREAPDE